MHFNFSSMYLEGQSTIIHNFVMHILACKVDRSQMVTFSCCYEIQLGIMDFKFWLIRKCEWRSQVESQNNSEPKLI